MKIVGRVPMPVTIHLSACLISLKVLYAHQSDKAANMCCYPTDTPRSLVAPIYHFLCTYDWADKLIGGCSMLASQRTAYYLDKRSRQDQNSLCLLGQMKKPIELDHGKEGSSTR